MPLRYLLFDAITRYDCAFCEYTSHHTQRLQLNAQCINHFILALDFRLRHILHILKSSIIFIYLHILIFQVLKLYLNVNGEKNEPFLTLQGFPHIARYN